MDGLHIFLTVLLGVSCSHSQMSGSVLEVTVRPGDNITLHCDCKLSTGVYIVWYRNCSHQNQPTLVLRTKSLKGQTPGTDDLVSFPNFHFLWNTSSKSFDLLIMNISDSDEGLYYCGTEESKVEENKCIKHKFIYTYGNITTRIIYNTKPYPECSPCPAYGVPESMMAFTPALTMASSLLLFILVYHICQKTDTQFQVFYKRTDTTGPTRHNEDEDVCLTRAVFWAQDEQIGRGQNEHLLYSNIKKLSK